MTDEIKISNDFCFEAQNVTIQTSQQALKSYSDNYEAAFNLEAGTPIFLDTNVLLDYYKISFSEREQLLKFFEANKERIHLTKQIEAEFLKHRIDHIKSYLKSLEEFVSSYRNIKSEIEKLKSGEVKGFDHYLNNNILKNDYQDLRTELTAFNETLKEKLKSVFQETDFEQQINEKEKRIEDIKKRLEGQADIERKDPLLDIISLFKVTPKLLSDEIEFLKSRYTSLNEKYEQIKADQNLNWKNTFPGCGEKKDDPYGDFYIYHEILKYMKLNNTDVIFLTNDVEKNDWLLRNKAELLPYTHYIINTFCAAQKTMYIFQAKDKIRVSYQAIYVEDKIEEVPASQEKELYGKVVLQGPKILGKIELSNINDGDDIDLDNLDFDKYEFVDITEEEFISELYQSQNWAMNYGDNFVGQRSFIFKYLGSKGYNFRTSISVKDNLITKEIVENWIHKPKLTQYNEVEAIRLTAKGIEKVKEFRNKPEST